MADHDTHDHTGVPGVGTVPAGTSFPVTPSSGDQFFRTDLGFAAYYDGTRWLTTNEYTLGFAYANAAVTSGASGSINVGRACIPYSGTYTLFLTALHIFCNSNSTNNGSNYMSIKLNRADVNETDTQIGSTLDTSADTAGQNVYKSLTINATLNTSAKQLKLRLDQAAGTGSSLIISAMLHYRLVLT